MFWRFSLPFTNEISNIFRYKQVVRGQPFYFWCRTGRAGWYGVPMTFFDPFIHHEFSFFLSMILRNAIKEILGEPKDTCRESFILFDKERTNLESTPREVAGQKKIYHCSEMEAVINDCQQVAPYIEYCVHFQLYDKFLHEGSSSIQFAKFWKDNQTSGDFVPPVSWKKEI